MQNQVNKPLTRSQERNKMATEGLVKGIAIFIVIAVAAFAEVSFLGMVSAMFPDNVVFKFAAIVGAIATGLSVVTLLFAKLKWIRAGHQHWLSWVFFGFEITIMVLNLILSFALAQPHMTAAHLDPWLYAYYEIMPATPIIAMIGWTLIFMTDRAKEKFDNERDLQEELEDAEMEHKREQHSILMNVRRSINHIQAEQMMREVEQRQPQIQRITQEVVAREIESLLGIYVLRNPNENVVEGSVQPSALPAPASFAQTGTINPPNDASEKRGIVDKIKDAFSNAADNQPHIIEEAIASGTAEQPAQEKPKSNRGRKKTDQEVKEGIEYYRNTGKLPEGWSSKQMSAYIRHRYPNGLDTKHDNLEEK